MVQTMTGPRGMVAYHKGEFDMYGNYPALNVPCRAFAKYGGFAANANHEPGPAEGIRRERRGQAVAIFGWPVPREV